MEPVIRVTIIYLVILFGLRVLGKREFGQLSPMELVSLLLIPELVSQAVTREDFSLTHAIIAVCTLLSLVFLTSALTHVNQRAADVLDGRPAVLVADGKLILKAMDNERVSVNELYNEMRKAGLRELDQVQWAILNADGKIAFLPKDQSQQVQTQSLDKNVVG
jgi:uncharacterized membrane protein YcaP (DUF421 family)